MIWTYLEYSKIKKEYTGLFWNIVPDFPKIKKTSFEVFSPFCKKGKRVFVDKT